VAGDRTVPRGVSRPGPSRRLADRSRLRSCAALLFVPALALALNYATSEPSSTSYVLELYALAARDVVALTPYVAVSATWEIATLRLLWARMPVTRNVAAVVAARLTLPVLGGLVIHTVVMAVVVRRGLQSYGECAVWVVSGWRRRLSMVCGGEGVRCGVSGCAPRNGR